MSFDEKEFQVRNQDLLAKREDLQHQLDDWHKNNPDADPAALIEDARQGFSGFIAVGEDLMHIDVARRRVAWRQATVGF